MIAIAYVVFTLCLSIGVNTLVRRLDHSSDRAQRIHVQVWLVTGVALLVMYAVIFQDLTFPPPSVLHGLSLLLVVALPVLLIVGCIMELRSMRRRPEEKR